MLKFQLIVFLNNIMITVIKFLDGQNENLITIVLIMYSVSSSLVELFRLRLLLLNCRGANSFHELKNVNGVQYMTLSEACLALDLIDDDEESSRTMQEAVSWMMPDSIRLLIVRILIYCQPVHPDELWKNFKDALSENFLGLY